MLSNSYNKSQSLALLTDFYQITMSDAYLKSGIENKEAVFHLSFRRRPFNGGFAITAGLEAVIHYLENFHFDDSDIAYLRSLRGKDDLPIFDDQFLNYLSNMEFSCDVDAIPEGNVVFPYEPLVRVQGPLIQCQLLESPLLNFINFASLIATKSARVCTAAKGDPVLEFGLRRAQGIDGALTASRSAYIGGCESTSNVLAGKLFGIPVRGTHAHSWVMAFDDELEAFMQFAKFQPNNSIFLVDTYDTLEGVEKAIEAGKWLKSQGKSMVAIRLDSGDLAYLSIKAREMLDQAGLPEVKILASNELDETLINELKRQGATINLWGVGTKLVTGDTQPALDGVYKLSALRNPGEDWRYKLKLSEQIVKTTNPGILQVRRFFRNQEYVADAIYDLNYEPKEDVVIIDPLDPTRQKLLRKDLQYRDMLVPIFRKGQKVYQSPSLNEIRHSTQKELDLFYTGVKRFINPHQYVVGMEKNLYDLKLHLIKNIRSGISNAFIVEEKKER